MDHCETGAEGASNSMDHGGHDYCRVVNSDSDEHLGPVSSWVTADSSLRQGLPSLADNSVKLVA